jgi:hypothetical protein
MPTENLIRFFIDHSFVVHGYLLILDVFATVVVVRGILWETSGPLDIHDIARKLVIWGVAAEAFLTIAIFVFDERISEALRCEGIALEKIMAPRVLAPSRLNRRGGINVSERKFKANLTPYQQIEVKIQSAHDAEAESVTADLKYLLNAKEIDETESHFAPTEIRGGITVYTFPLRNSPAVGLAQALYRALKDAELVVYQSVMPPQGGVTGPRFAIGPSDNREFVYVAVGPRPMGEQLAELKEHPPTSCD